MFCFLALVMAAIRMGKISCSDFPSIFSDILVSRKIFLGSIPASAGWFFHVGKLIDQIASFHYILHSANIRHRKTEAAEGGGCGIRRMTGIFCRSATAAESLKHFEHCLIFIHVIHHILQHFKSMHKFQHFQIHGN